MSNIKKAFTLAEIMIMLAIIATMMTVLIQVSNPFAPKFKSLYYYAFSNMRKFGGETVAASLTRTIDTNDVNFCSNLVNDLNTVGENSGCVNFYDGTKALPFFGMTESDLDKPTFAISNGQRFYISKRVDEITIGYRVLAVDLNGKSRPNKFNEDVVPFVMFDTGEVMPIGVPAENKDYLMVYAKVYRAYSGTPKNEYVNNGKSDNLLTYREGYCLAGYKSAYSDYCDSTAAFIKAIAPAPACTPNNSSTFCKISLIKPIINVKI